MVLTVVTRNVHGTSSRPAYRCWIPRCRNGNATSPSRYTEDNLVQRTTAEYLAEQLGWESVYAHNHEDFGPESLLGRASEHEVVLVRTLRRALAELNPGRPEAAFDDAGPAAHRHRGRTEHRCRQPGDVRVDPRRRAGHLPQ